MNMTDRNSQIVRVYTMRNCPYCVMAKRLLSSRGVAFEEILVPLEDETQWDSLEKISGMKTMPQIFFREKLIGGYSDLSKLDQRDGLESLKT